MLGSIKYNLSHLLDFSGRDARQTFWYYVLFLVLIEYAIGMATAIPLMVGMMGTVFEAARAGASEQEVQAAMSGQMSGMMGGVLWVSVVTRTLMALLLLAAFVRRLHDSNKSGWWASLPLAGQLFGIFVAIRMMDLMPRMFEGMTAAQGNPANMLGIYQDQPELVGYSLIGWLGPLLVIVFGVMKSTDGPNRYGEAPVRF